MITAWPTLSAFLPASTSHVLGLSTGGMENNLNKVVGDGGMGSDCEVAGGRECIARLELGPGSEGARNVVNVLQPGLERRHFGSHESGYVPGRYESLAG